MASVWLFVAVIVHRPRVIYEVDAVARWGPYFIGDWATPTLSSACHFMMGLGKPQLRAKFEVANPSSCRNIIGEPQNFGELP